MPSKFARLLKSIGPGLVTGASDDDPSGIATYSQAGAQFGLSTLWTALVTFPLMAAIQEMCARIGVITSKGLITNINEHYSRPVVYLVIFLMTPAIVLNIGADISSMGAVANLLFTAIPAFIYSILFTLFMLFIIIKKSYVKTAKFLKYLCVSLFFYIIVPFLVHKDWLAIAKATFIPHIQFNKEFIGILVAILGTTISPYLFFWQATMEAEDRRHRNIFISKQYLKYMRIDVNFGMFASNIIMYFIILTTGIVLFSHGNHGINTVEQAASALEPVAGKLCYLLFALGVIGTGLLAVPVLSGSLSYVFTSAFNLNEGLDKKFHQARFFYMIIAVSLFLGLCINVMGINPIQTLLYSAILYGILAPPLIFIILLISNNKKIMGKYTNGKWSNILGIIGFLFMSIAAVTYLVI